MSEIKEEKYYVISESQLSDMLDKVSHKIIQTTNKKGEYSIGSSIVNSMNDTIKFYLDKNCKK